jgi:uncharacterized protein YneF (UPF0154 family)
MEMPSFLLPLDPYLIWFYRLPGNAYVGFILGTLVLVLICLVIGDITFFLATRIMGKHLERVAGEALKYQDLSIQAAKAGDKYSFKAANQVANDAFGQSFFSLCALSMARLWPVPFALAWMQYRFLELGFPIPGTPWSLGYIGAFIIIYALAYFLIKHIVRRLPFSRQTAAIPAADPGHAGAADLPPEQKNVYTNL